MTARGKGASLEKRQVSVQLSVDRLTPLRLALMRESPLRPLVTEGLGAVKANERDCFDASVRIAFGDSLDLDAAMQSAHPQSNRWDYLLGHTDSGDVVAVEPHSAKTEEISTLIGKRQAARDQLIGHLCSGAKVAKWLWVTSGKVHFANTERVRRQLDQHGIEFVGTKVLLKHLPSTKQSSLPGRKRKA